MAGMTLFLLSITILSTIIRPQLISVKVDTIQAEYPRLLSDLNVDSSKASIITNELISKYKDDYKSEFVLLGGVAAFVSLILLYVYFSAYHTPYPNALKLSAASTESRTRTRHGADWPDAVANIFSMGCCLWQWNRSIRGATRLPVSSFRRLPSHRWLYYWYLDAPTVLILCTGQLRSTIEV
jgi:hypothetical protein